MPPILKRRSGQILVVGGIISAALFIAGAVMLGVGISRSNSASSKPPVKADPYYITVTSDKVTPEDLQTDYPKALNTFKDLVSHVHSINLPRSLK